MNPSRRPQPTTTPNSVLNALCVDVDELSRSFAEAGHAVSQLRYDVVAETEDLLAELENLGLRATLFIPGHFLDGGAALVQTMAAAGHQIASHGTHHSAVEHLTPTAFYQDLNTSKKQLEDCCGQPVDTYKAPMWSITPRCLWAYDTLIEAGFRVDHSAMPPLVEKLGQRRRAPEPFHYQEQLVVIPATTARFFGLPFPFPGGFYNAWLPHAFHRHTYDRLNRRGLPFNFYFHPFEHSPRPPQRRWAKQRSLFISLYAAHAGCYRRKLRRLARHYALGPLGEAYRKWLPTP